MAAQPIEQEHRDWVLAALEEYERPLTRYAVRLVGDMDAARDAVQHTFLRLCDADRTKVAGYLAPWLYTVCRHKALDLVRGRHVERLNGKQSARLSGREPDPCEVVEQSDLTIWVGRLLDDLPVSQREVLDLLLDGFSYAAIAEITSRSAGNVRVIVHRAIAGLREHPRVRELLDGHGGACETETTERTSGAAAEQGPRPTKPKQRASS